MKHKIKLIGILSAAVLVIGLSGYAVYKYVFPLINTGISQKEKVTEIITEPDPTMIPISILEEAPEIPEISPTPAPEIKQEPLLTDEVKPADIYILPGSNGKFTAFYPEAEYFWEYYNELTAEWETAANNESMEIITELDEFYREVSCLEIEGTKENDGIRVRCNIMPAHHEQDAESLTYEVRMHLLPEVEDIDTISVQENVIVDAGSMISSLEIPITITLKNGDIETVTGLYDLFFYVQQTSSSDMTREEGMTVETITTTAKENTYYGVEHIGESVVMLKFRGVNPSLDIEAMIEGIDHIAPEISNVSLSSYTIGKEDLKEPITITATIEAMDNFTSKDNLKYAIVEESKEISDEDYQSENCIDFEVFNNSVFIAYVKDEAENVATYDVSIVATDQKAPVINSVQLKDGTAWNTFDTIMVDATDASDIEYCFSLGATDSGWISYNEYTIDRNGTWIVKVRDVAGNESTKDIEVSNVDSIAPTILEVLTGRNASETSLADRVDVTINGAGTSDITQSNSKTVDSYIIGNDSKNSIITAGTEWVNNTVSSGTGTTTAKGEKGETGAAGATGATGAAGAKGESGTNYYMHVRYSTTAQGTNMRNAPSDDTKYIGIYTGAEKSAPSNPSHYVWSKYQGNSSYVFIRYAPSANGENMTSVPTESTFYMGICTSSDVQAPITASSYIWSKYREESTQVYIMYSENADGSDMTTVPSSNSKYLGIYTGTDSTAPADPALYNWSQLGGASDAEITSLQNQIDELKEQIQSLSGTP